MSAGRLLPFALTPLTLCLGKEMLDCKHKSSCYPHPNSWKQAERSDSMRKKFTHGCNCNPNRRGVVQGPKNFAIPNSALFNRPLCNYTSTYTQTQKARANDRLIAAERLSVCVAVLVDQILFQSSHPNVMCEVLVCQRISEVSERGAHQLVNEQKR